uniref:Cilia-and flagella-associated protein 96 n=1 Tax=Trichobilharzia regenti TaxID=157069 RepID=A0AA85JJL2_TRIRE|nr:unnamed protein product [Trichobilharzia regenti]
MTSKTDLQRLGIFKELSYTTIEDPYVPQYSFLQPVIRDKASPPFYLPGGRGKTKASNDDGYFAPFQRVFSGEAGITIRELRRRWLNEDKSKHISDRPWMPNNGQKHRSGVGSYMGCFQEVYEAFDPSVAKVELKTPEKKNFYTSPGKKGTGYGYTDVCLNPFTTWQPGDTLSGHRFYAEATEYHKAKVGGRPTFVSTCRSLDAFDENPWAGGDPLAPGGQTVTKLGIENFPASMRIGPVFIPSSPAKLDGGMKDGTIGKFPEYSSEAYMATNTLYPPQDKSKVVAGNWIPNPYTAVNVPQPSIVNKNIDLRVNVKTRKDRQKVWDICK